MLRQEKNEYNSPHYSTCFWYGVLDGVIPRDGKRAKRCFVFWILTIRTRVIDEYILKYQNQGYKTIINLGAGLDTRPYRLDLPEATQWIEVENSSIGAHYVWRKWNRNAREYVR